MRIRTITSLLVVLTTCAAAMPVAAQSRVYAANAASFAPGLSPGVVALYTTSLFAPVAVSAGALPLPLKLAGVEVLINGEAAGLFFVGYSQINLNVPDKFAGATVAVDVYRDNQLTHTSIFTISPAFGLFSANARGQGLAAGVVFDSSFQAYRPLVTSANQPIPIECGSGANPNYLILYGTGASLAGRDVQAWIDGVWQVSYAGPVDKLEGLQQVNIPLSPILADKGWTEVWVIVDGVPSNKVLVFFQ